MASSLDGYASTSKEIRSIVSVDKKREPNKRRRKNPKPRHLSSYGKKKTPIQPSETETKSKDKSVSLKTDSDVETKSKGKRVSLKTDSDVETKSKGKRVSLKTDSDVRHIKKKNTSSKEQQLVLKEPVPENLPIIPQFIRSVQINDDRQDRTKNVKNLEGGNFGFEQCVKIIRQLECSGHLKTSFRQKLLTWFSLKATTQEIKVVKTFIHSFKDDPMALAEQFIDIFSNCVPRKGSAVGDYYEGGSSGALSKKSRH